MSRIAALAAALLAASLLTAATACGDDTPAAPTTTTEATAMAPTVSFDKTAGVLDIGGTKLTQFTGYEPSQTFEIPHGWPAKSEIVIEAIGDRQHHPKVSAAAFGDAPAPPPHDRLVDQADVMILDERGPTRIEDSLAAEGRACRYRISDGWIGSPDLQIGSGVIIVSEADRATLGLHIHGPDFADVERLTVDIARQLCAEPAAEA